MKHINIPEVGVKNLEPITGQLSMSPHFFSLHIPWILIIFYTVIKQPQDK